MKRTIVALLLVSSLAAQSQPFAGIEVSSKGFGLSAGYKSEIPSLEIRFQYDAPLIRADVAQITSLNLGYQLVLLDRDDYGTDKFSVTPSIGVGAYRVEDFSDYYSIDSNGVPVLVRGPNRDQSNIITVSSIKPVFNLTWSRDLYMGRYFFSVSLCEKAYFSIGLRGYIK